MWTRNVMEIGELPILVIGLKGLLTNLFKDITIGMLEILMKCIKFK